MIAVRSLGYIGIAAPDPRACLDYATDILGMMPARAVAGEAFGLTDRGESSASGGSGIACDGTVYLKLDEWQWRIAVHPETDRRGLIYAGFEIGSRAELESSIAILNERGIAARIGTAEEARARSVTGIGYTQDPAGNGIELFYGPVMDGKFVSPHGVQYVTGAMGLGHLNLFVSDLAPCQDFYMTVLGFRLSDYFCMGGDASIQFLHCNPRHHTVGLAGVAPINALQHLMLEMASIDQVGQCLGRAEAAGLTITGTLGRHSNDGVLSFYMESPFGCDVEIGWEGVRIGPDWIAREFVEGDIWGHKGIAENVGKMAQMLIARGGS